MQKILFLMPAEYMVPYAQEALRDYPDISVWHSQTQRVLRELPRYVDKGVEIICARGGISYVLNQAQAGVSVVDIQVTTVEIINAITEAKLHGRNIAVLAHATMVIGLEFLAPVLGGSVRQYEVRYNQDYDAAVSRAVADGAEVIVGGALACAAAKRQGLPHSVLQFAKESLWQAAKDARRLLEALEAESAKRDMLQVALDTSHDGVITTDAANTITAVNKAAVELLGSRGKPLVGMPLLDALPQMRSGDVKKGKKHGDSFFTLGKNKLLYESTPIRRNNTLYSTVLTLRKISDIQKMEARIREELYARGHIAKFSFDDVVGDSREIHDAVALARDYARTDSSVLILGETGTGKEVFAQSIHNASARASGPFVAINCAALPTHLLESELFGYVGGAFTGASREGKPGLFEVAHGGTIFLDEMAEMDYANQGRLLRFHQERSVVRLGSFKVIPVDVRIIVATNKNLAEFVRQNKFRDDLYHRLNVLRLELPPLRNRKRDIRLHADAFLRQFLPETQPLLSKGAQKALEAYTWPGNVRELRNVIERVAARLKTSTVTGTMLREMLDSNLSTASLTVSSKRDRLVREITEALKLSNNNQGEAAALLGVNRTTLYRRMKKYGITC